MDPENNQNKENLHLISYIMNDVLTISKYGCNTQHKNAFVTDRYKVDRYCHCKIQIVFKNQRNLSNVLFFISTEIEKRPHHSTSFAKESSCEVLCRYRLCDPGQNIWNKVKKLIKKVQ